MTKELIEENFNKCIDWVRNNVGNIGVNPLYIGWGDKEHNHPWMEREFENRDYSLSINHNDLNVSIRSYGCYHIQTFGYDKDYIEKWEKSYVGTGMNCPHYKHTFEELSVNAKEKFLMEWNVIKSKILQKIREVKSLENFEV